MSDEKLRELERACRETGSEETELAWLRERARAGEKLDWESFSRLHELDVEAAAAYLRWRVEVGDLTQEMLDYYRYLCPPLAEWSLLRDRLLEIRPTPNLVCSWVDRLERLAAVSPGNEDGTKQHALYLLGVETQPSQDPPAEKEAAVYAIRLARDSLLGRSASHEIGHAHALERLSEISHMLVGVQTAHSELLAASLGQDQTMSGDAWTDDSG